jgi:hypothetical protein
MTIHTRERQQSKIATGGAYPKTRLFNFIQTGYCHYGLGSGNGSIMSYPNRSKSGRQKLCMA